MGTQGGHILAFDPMSADVLFIHHHLCHVSALVCLGSTEQVVVFGTQKVEAMEDDEEQTVFTVWDSYLNYRIT